MLQQAFGSLLHMIVRRTNSDVIVSESQTHVVFQELKIPQSARLQNITLDSLRSYELVW